MLAVQSDRRKKVKTPYFFLSCKEGLKMAEGSEIRSGYGPVEHFLAAHESNSVVLSSAERALCTAV